MSKIKKDEFMEKEVAKLVLANDNFSKEMRDRLLQKYEEGYRGWNNLNNNAQLRLVVIESLAGKTEKAVSRLSRKQYDKVTKKHLVDIANYAMMLLKLCEDDLND